MTVSELRRKLKKHIDRLPPERLNSAADYLAFLADDESASAAAQSMKARIREAERQIAEGQVTSVSQLRRKY